MTWRGPRTTREWMGATRLVLGYAWYALLGTAIIAMAGVALWAIGVIAIGTITLLVVCPPLGVIPLLLFILFAMFFGKRQA